MTKALLIIREELKCCSSIYIIEYIIYMYMYIICTDLLNAFYFLLLLHTNIFVRTNKLSFYKFRNNNHNNANNNQNQRKNKETKKGFIFSSFNFFSFSS